MWSIRRSMLVVFSLAISALATVRASDWLSEVDLELWMRPGKLSTARERARQYVQTTPNITLSVAGKQLRPPRLGLVYRQERATGDQLLLSARYEGVEGWAHASAVVPLTEADAFFSRLIVDHPRDSFAFLMRGVVRHENDQFDLAFADLNESLRHDPKCVAALTARAHLWLVRSRPDQALLDLKKAIELDPRNAHAFAERGMLFTSAKDYDKALPDYERAIQLGSRSTAVSMGLTMIHLERRELDKAKNDIDHTLELDPNHVIALAELGMFHLMRWNVKDALSVLNRAIEIDPRCDMIYGLRATVALSLGKYDQALNDLNEAIYLNPRSSLHFQNRGGAEFLQGRLQACTGGRGDGDPSRPQKRRGSARACVDSGDLPGCEHPQLSGSGDLGDRCLRFDAMA